MKITSIKNELVLEIPFLNAGRGSGDYFRDSLPVHHGFVDVLPKGMSAIIVTADLQGRETSESASGRPPRLLGEVLPKMLASEIIPNLDVTDGNVGVLLAGDFYTVPALDKRGGTGDVREVWNAFADAFDWVVGVAGNHDLFGDEACRPRFSGAVHFLDDDSVQIESLSIAGVSGIPGNPRRPWRRSEDDYIETLESLLLESPTIMLLHDGPDIQESKHRGSPRIRAAIENFETPLVVRGHSHWSEPLGVLANGTQVLNVDCRVVILTEQPS